MKEGHGLCFKNVRVSGHHVTGTVNCYLHCICFYVCTC